MRNVLKIFGFHNDPNGPRPAGNGMPTFIAGRGVRFGPARDWSGLHDRKPFELNFDRVAVCRASRFGTDSQSKVVAIDWFGPEFVSKARALRLIESGMAKYFGIDGGE